MDKEIAHHFAYETWLISIDLSDLLEFIGHHCKSKEEHKKLSEKITAIKENIEKNLLNHVYNQYPEIKIEIEEKVKKYGRLIL